MAQIKKIKYEAPKVKKIGDFEAITKMHHNGQNLDATFAGGTPLNQITTS